MSYDRFDAITRCLHVQMYIYSDKGASRGHRSYDKLHKVRWLMDERDRSKEQRNLGEKMTTDKMMVYGKDCAIRPYLPNKSKKWGNQDMVSNQCGRQISLDMGRCIVGRVWEEYQCSKVKNARKGDPVVSPKVVQDLVLGLEGYGHVVLMDNYFSSGELFHTLCAQDLYATGIIHSNIIGLP